MWLVATTISMIIYSMVEIVAAKTISMRQEFGILKLRISAITVDGIALLILYILYYRNSGVSIFSLIVNNPLIIIVASLNVLDCFLYLKAIKYIGLTIQEAYNGVANIILFLGMIFINFFSGRIEDVRRMLILRKLIFIVLLIVASFVLPKLGQSKDAESHELKKVNRRNVILGLSLTLLGQLFDAVESLLQVYIFSESDITSIDYMAVGFLIALFWGVVFYIILYSKSKTIFIPFKKGDRWYLIYGVINVVFLIPYLYGMSLAPVQSSIIWVSYSVIPIAGAAVILKERYNLKQYICIVIITFSSIAFSLMELL